MTAYNMIHFCYDTYRLTVTIEWEMRDVVESGGMPGIGTVNIPIAYASLIYIAGEVIFMLPILFECCSSTEWQIPKSRIKTQNFAQNKNLPYVSR